MKTMLNKSWIPALAGALTVAVMLFFSGCGGGGGGPSGHSTVMGSVKSFKTATALYQPAMPSGVLAKLAGAVSDLFVPRAQAAVAGCIVSIKGTDLSTTTANDGLFVISGVSSGTVTIVFTFKGDSVELTIQVPDHATVHLDGVICDGGDEDVDDDGSVEVEDESIEDDDHDEMDDDETTGHHD